MKITIFIASLHQCCFAPIYYSAGLKLEAAIKMEEERELEPTEENIGDIEVAEGKLLRKMKEILP
jgi:hypothetical protein